MTTARNCRKFFINALSILSCLTLCHCVSVNLAPTEASKAEKISFSAPQLPFKFFETESADKAWRSSKTGNTLAYLSECNQADDISLKSLQIETLNALTDLKIITSDSSTFEDRESLSALAEGKVDGVPAKLMVVVFKKNGCNFTLSFMGRKSLFESELTNFEKFKESFRVP